MYTVRLYDKEGKTKEYTTGILQYAKRYADLYRDESAFIEILFSDGISEKTVETFGSREKVHINLSGSLKTAA